jgi:hypothetical protein
MDEVIKLRGARLDYRQQLKVLEYRAENHIMTIRDKLDPLIEWDEIEIDHAEQAMISLKVILKQANDIREKIEDINRRIGADE